MASRGSRRRRRPVRLDERWVALVAIAGGVAAALLSDANPTGEPRVGQVLVGVAVAGVAWAAASANWWVLVLATGAAAVTAGDSTLTIIGALAFLAALWIGFQRRDQAVPRAAVAAVALNVLARSELDGFHGISTVVAVATAAALAFSGLRRRHKRTRRIAWAVIGVGALATLAAVAGFGAAAMQARTLLTDGQRLATTGIEQVGRGEFAAATESFTQANAAFGAANVELQRPWTRGIRLVPVAAQNAAAVTDLSTAAAGVSGELSAALSQVDPEQLRVVDGRFDLDAVEAAAEPLGRVQDSIAQLDATIAAMDSPWLAEPLRQRIDRLAGDIDENESLLDNAVLAAQVAPSLLGGDGTRHYLIMFTTPAEARGLGGFMGNFAELEVSDGRITVSSFGRTGELNRGGPDPLGRTVSGPEEWLTQWGRYGFQMPPNGTTGFAAWSNITISPDFPSTAQVAAELYPQSGGRELDGVFAMDPYVAEAFLRFTGAVTIEGTDQRIDHDNVVEFLLKEQYAIDDQPERVDLLEQVWKETIDRLLDGALPGPVDMATELGPLVAEGRLVAWSVHADEQALFDQVNLSGALPRLGPPPDASGAGAETADGGADAAADPATDDAEFTGAHAAAVVVNNAAPNKIDVYLARELTYDVTFDPHTGEARGAVTVELTNTAPRSGLPNVVLGNQFGLPFGTNRALVSVYTGLPALSVSRDGEPAQVEPGRDHGWYTYRLRLDIPPGATTTLQLEIAGYLPTDTDTTVTTRIQPLVIPEVQTLDVTVLD